MEENEMPFFEADEIAAQKELSKLSKEELIDYILHKQEEEDESDFKRYDTQKTKTPFIQDEYALKTHLLKSDIAKEIHDLNDAIMQELTLSNFDPEEAFIYTRGRVSAIAEWQRLGMFQVCKGRLWIAKMIFNGHRAIGGAERRILSASNVSGNLDMAMPSDTEHIIKLKNLENENEFKKFSKMFGGGNKDNK